jgi:putative FmdB family regulatory protein
MPIYAYKCSACGYAQDEMQKIADAVLTQCPSCGKPDYVKQLSAAGFQLKGSGWYATDFKGGNKPADKPADKPAEKSDAPSATPTPATPAST